MYQNLLFHIYMKLNMFRATHRPSSGAYNCTGSLWFFIRVDLCIIVQFIKKNPTRCNSASKFIIPYLYEA